MSLNNVNYLIALSMTRTNFNHQYYIPLWVTALLFVLSHAYAQEKTFNEEITVITSLNPIIPDAFKINQNPEVNDTTTAIPAMSYSVMPRNAGIKMEIETLPAVKLVAEPLTKLYRNYLKAGLGNYYSFYGELYASSLRSKSHLLGVHVKHFSSGGKIEDYGPTANSTQNANIFGQKYFANHTLSGNAFFKRNGLQLYGYKPSDFNDTSISRDDLKQRYLTFGTGVTFTSRYKDGNKLNHSIGLSFYHLADTYKVKENNMKTTANLSKQADLFKWDKKQVLGVAVSYNFLNQQDSLSKINIGVLCIQPTLTASYQEYTFKAGFGFYAGIDTVTNGHLYPLLEAKLGLIPGGLQLYAGIDGGLERNSVQSMSEQNPFISSGLPLNYMNNKFRAYGGFTSNISRNFNFNGSISNTTIENYPFFVTDTLNPLLNTFTLLQDDISVTKVKAELEYIRNERLRLGIVGGYYSYDPGDQEYAWYKPAFDLVLTATYNMQDKIHLKFQSTYRGPVWALTPDTDQDTDAKAIEKSLSSRKIDGWLDISLGAEYRFKKALSFWLNLNNLTNNQHFSWYNYPSYRFNLLGGLTYSF